MATEKGSACSEPIKVTNKKSEWICLIVMFLVVEIWCVVMMCFYERFRLMGIIISVLWACFALFMYSCETTIYIEGTTIRGTLEFGKKFSFECADIKKITCKQHGAGYRSSKGTRIVIETEAIRLPVEGYKQGFEKCAAYLLELHENGLIAQESISVADKKAIRKCVAERKRS